MSSPVCRTGPVYLVTAAVIGAWFIVGAVRVSESRVMAFFGMSIVYLSVLFTAVAIDSASFV